MDCIMSIRPFYKLLLNFNLSLKKMMKPTPKFSPGISKMITGRTIADKTKSRFKHRD